MSEFWSFSGEYRVTLKEAKENLLDIPGKTQCEFTAVTTEERHGNTWVITVRAISPCQHAKLCDTLKSLNISSQDCLSACEMTKVHSQKIEFEEGPAENTATDIYLSYHADRPLFDLRHDKQKLSLLLRRTELNSKNPHAEMFSVYKPSNPPKDLTRFTKLSVFDQQHKTLNTTVSDHTHSKPWTFSSLKSELDLSHVFHPKYHIKQSPGLVTMYLTPDAFFDVYQLRNAFENIDMKWRLFGGIELEAPVMRGNGTTTRGSVLEVEMEDDPESGMSGSLEVPFHLRYQLATIGNEGGKSFNLIQFGGPRVSMDEDMDGLVWDTFTGYEMYNINVPTANVSISEYEMVKYGTLAVTILSSVILVVQILRLALKQDTKSKSKKK